MASARRTRKGDWPRQERITRDDRRRRRIIDGLEAAIAGDLAAVTINGQRWVRKDGPTVPEAIAYESGYLAGLEEAARIAEGKAPILDDEGEHGDAWIALNIAKAIRARIAELRKEPAK